MSVDARRVRDVPFARCRLRSHRVAGRSRARPRSGRDPVAKAIRLPSGDHAGSSSSSALNVICLTCEPSASVTKISWSPSGFANVTRSLLNASLRPSARQFGAKSSALELLVRATSPLPSGFIAQMSKSAPRPVADERDRSVADRRNAPSAADSATPRPATQITTRSATDAHHAHHSFHRLHADDSRRRLRLGCNHAAAGCRPRHRSSVRGMGRRRRRRKLLAIATSAGPIGP